MRGKDKDRFLSGLYPSTCPAWVTLSEASSGWHSKSSNHGKTQRTTLRRFYDIECLWVKGPSFISILERQVIGVTMLNKSLRASQVR
ncbi:hypothetical protein ElyMa_004080800 [Elysia marginata]|uniref:Uncharacterized protein n=1 Tax=Elysia marginata TaxID=1093978 RepID=A0AAV4G8J3_9GAST|nr:hypothetical protein ElyMa_004080800 [Elysia marginata]